ncbi:1-aminocyclopropane-1-carboxylate deaminase/D-cysteine desulfhydrase [Oceanisphaera arctica]|uniref:1-aminocyclopropane-1-carboxylate deaminase n=1 Tax=Oceanisphaera arctica TaxID=641510 RepID=A0A2P5TKM0_9GAMM|nr:pyridoxal-phosphate dependent enzyme [Oceanisphaera arctica]PPL15730.1 1-aminocyclopropane-1-carboxylate deaminase [Oceanisphaera arctica]GHA04832.1 1-aminocyclopropane-1-carboxylate deaminase [Oceanisphaera arctica]
MSDLSCWQHLYQLQRPSPLQRLCHPLLEQHRLTLWIKRDDLLHHLISGNKWRKLKYTLRQALSEQAGGLLSFGGAYSNHLHALAAAGHRLGLPTVGMVRGESHSNNPTLEDARRWGMTLEFVDRQQYRRRQDADWLAELTRRHPGYLIIPEGGSCPQALPGVAELWQEVGQELPELDEVILPVASGGTLAGLLSARPASTRVRGYAVLKGAGWLAEEVCRLYPPAAQDNGWQLELSHHGGGYAKSSAADKAAIAELAVQLKVPLEAIYSGKALLGLFRDIADGRYAAGSRLLFLHTGGMQGARGAL